MRKHRFVKGLGRFPALIILAALFLALPVPPGAAEPVPGTADSAVLDAYRDAYRRLPGPEELRAWQEALDGGASQEELLENLRESKEYDALRHHRKEEAKDLVLAILPLLLVFVIAWFTLVRKKPERRLLFALFVFLYTPLALNPAYVFQKSHYGDFPSFYYGADYVYNQDRSPYGTVLSVEVEKHIFPFFHPPPSLAVFYPLSKISYHQALLWLNVFNQTALVLLLYLLILKGRRENLLLPVCLMVYFFSFYPLRMTLDYGQLNLWTTLFICLFIHASTRERSNALAGLSLTGAIVLKIYPACLLAWLVLKGKWKAIGWCLGGLGLFVLLGLVTVPWHIWESWWMSVGSRGSVYGGTGPVGIFSPAGSWNQGLNGLLMRVFTDNQFSTAIIRSPQLGKAATYLISLATLVAGGGILLARSRRGIEGDRELEIGLVLVMMSVVVPLSWVHHAVMLLPAIFAAARRLVDIPRAPIWTLFCLSAFGLAWNWAWFPDEHFRLFQGGWSMLLGSMRAFALLGLLIVMILLLAEPWRSGRNAGPAAPTS